MNPIYTQINNQMNTIVKTAEETVGLARMTKNLPLKAGTISMITDVLRLDIKVKSLLRDLISSDVDKRLENVDKIMNEIHEDI